MTLKTQMTSDMSAFFNTDEFAEDVTYTAVGQAGATIPAIIDRDSSFLEPYVRGRDTATCEISVKKSDVATPKYGDTFTFNSETWDYDAERGVIYEDDDTLIIGLVRRD